MESESSLRGQSVIIASSEVTSLSEFQLLANVKKWMKCVLLVGLALLVLLEAETGAGGLIT